MIKMKSLLIVLFSLFLCACVTTPTDPEQIYAGQSADQIFAKAKTEIQNGAYGKAIKDLEGLDSLYPFSKHAREAKLDIIYAYYRNGDSPSATAAAERFIRLYPRDKNVDYAYYMRGLATFNQFHSFLVQYLPYDYAQRDLSSMKKAYKHFADLLHYFPHSKYAADARSHMLYIRNRFAQHHIDTADYYMQRRAFVAAANRANVVIKEFPHTPAVERALVILVQANRMMKLNGPANNALRVLEANYPKSKELPALRSKA